MAQAANNIEVIPTKKNLDEELIKDCVALRRIRAELNLFYASRERRDGSVDLSKLIYEKDELEDSISQERPKTVYGAHLMLEVAIDIVAAHTRDPESLMGFGPVQQILQKVENATAFSEALLPGAQYA